MTKQKQKRAYEKTLHILKKFWWAVAIVAVGIGWLLYTQISAYRLQQRFDGTYQQLTTVYQSLRSSSLATRDSQDSIQNLCKKNWYGFTSDIECGTYLIVFIGSSNYTTIQNALQTILKDHGFKEVYLSQSNQEETSQGTGTFMSQNNISCGVYWGPENKISQKSMIDLYCCEVVPNYLPGYVRE